jgi:hypothetical protein
MRQQIAMAYEFKVEEPSTSGLIHFTGCWFYLDREDGQVKFGNDFDLYAENQFRFNKQLEYIWNEYFKEIDLEYQLVDYCLKSAFSWSKS